MADNPVLCPCGVMACIERCPLTLKPICFYCCADMQMHGRLYKLEGGSRCQVVDDCKRSECPNRAGAQKELEL